LSSSQSSGAVFNNHISDKSFKHFDCGGKCSTNSTLCGLTGMCPYTKHLLTKEVVVNA